MVDDTTAPVIDFSAHLYAENISQESYSDNVDEISTDPEQYLKWFKKGGVDKAVLSQPYYMGYENVEETVEANDDLLSVIREFDDFLGLAAVPLGAGGEAAATEFERCLDEGYNGGGISTTVGKKDLLDSEFEPVWEVADRTGAPLLVHPTSTRRLQADEHVLERLYQLNHTFGREAQLCGSISKVIHSGLLDKYQNLNLVYHHLGGNIACMMGRIDLRLHRNPPDAVTGETMEGIFGGSINTGETKSFEEYKNQLEQRIFIDTAGYYMYHTPFQAAVEQFPASNILFGTDAAAEPKTPGDLQKFLSTIDDVAPLSHSRKILSHNAADLLVNI